MEANQRLISTLLRHDAKQTSYKIALVRALSDVALAYPDLRTGARQIAVPLRLLAQFWLAYYWPLMADEKPILQGARTFRGGVLRHDLSFRPALSKLKRQWRDLYGTDHAADGFVLIHELNVPRKRQGFPAAFLADYDEVIKRISAAIGQPIQYAGGGAWRVFAKPRKLASLTGVMPVPGARADDVCLVLDTPLWRTLGENALWIEALCIHEWCLFSERVEQPYPVSRGEVYTLLSERPDTRRPLTWERNGVELLMPEGHEFICPWSFKPLTPGHFDLDHLVPVAVYPINELWNLVPADPRANNLKRARMPSVTRWEAATPHLSRTYSLYGRSVKLGSALRGDVTQRFILDDLDPDTLTRTVGAFMAVLTRSRNLSVF